MDYISGLDRGTYYWFWAHPTPHLQPVMLTLAALGSPTVLVLVVLLAVGLFLALRRYRLALFVLAATLGGAGAAEAFQALIERPPVEATVDWLNLPEAPAGFPGGSALLAAVIYLTLALVAACLVPGRAVQAVLISASALLALLIGVSRLYLGLHFVSDMLAAWVGGLAWALASRAVWERWFSPARETSG